MKTKLCRPGLAVKIRIFHGKAIDNLSIRITRKALSHFAILSNGGRALLHLLWIHIDCLYYQSIIFIPAYRVSHVLLQDLRSAIVAGLRRRAKDRNDSRIVHLFYVDHHIIISLHELIVVIVQTALHRWTSFAFGKNTTLRKRQGLGAVSITDAGDIATAETSAPIVRSRVFQTWHLPVLRINYVRSSKLALHQCKTRARVHPEVIICSCAEIFRACLRRVIDTIILIEPTLNATDRYAGSDNLGVFRRHHQCIHTRPAREIGQRSIAPDTLQVGASGVLGLCERAY